MSKVIADKLKLVRHKLDLTQQELAHRLNVPYRTLVNWENDHQSPRGLALEALLLKLDTLLKPKKKK